MSTQGTVPMSSQPNGFMSMEEFINNLLRNGGFVLTYIPEEQHKEIKEKEMLISPRPWHWNFASGMNNYAIRDFNNNIVCGLPTENGADARLIAAAPDLLAVCETILRHRQVVLLDETGTNLLDLAEKAVKKARGK